MQIAYNLLKKLIILYGYPCSTHNMSVYIRELRHSFLRSLVPIKHELIPHVDEACTRQLVNLTHNLSRSDNDVRFSFITDSRIVLYSLKTTPWLYQKCLNLNIGSLYNYKKGFNYFHLFYTAIVQQKIEDCFQYNFTIKRSGFIIKFYCRDVYHDER